ncbi:hypothetical protein [Pirellulimonas nuda]|nr:hypothetical protein [Pirellulimonas nuda]
MTRPRLKLYNGPEAQATDHSGADARTVTVPVGEVLPLLADAIESRRTWLKDFEDDELTLPSDLYEVLMAYRYFRRPSA